MGGHSWYKGYQCCTVNSLSALQAMSDFFLPFDLSAYDRLDQCGLLACQEYNLGNTTDWFGTFRGGLYDFYARIHGVATHFQTVHAWLPKPRIPIETEYHLASIFSNMDSAVECLTFALNALGYAVAPQSFRDITDDQALRRVKPRDILGTRKTPPLAGYTLIFPTLQAHWQENRDLLSIIIEQHDVSKHRETIYTGGMARLDPPHGFYEALGIGDDPARRAMYWPMAEIILRKDPKTARATRKPQPAQDWVHLETVAEDFCQFVNESGVRALDDAITNIKLPHSEFVEDEQ